MSAEERTTRDADSAPETGGDLNLMAAIPDLFEKFFEFFRPGHTEGAAPARIKELARLKIAAINECDT